MKKPAAGGQSGAGLSRNERAEQDSQFIADPPRRKQASRRKVKTYKPPPRYPNTIDMEDWLAQEDEV